MLVVAIGSMRNQRLSTCWGLAWLAALTVWLTPGVAGAIPFSGALEGSFTGRLARAGTDKSGTITGTWSADADLSPVVRVNSVTASGTFGGPGVSGTWMVTTFDTATNTLVVGWTAPSGRGPASSAGSGTADGSVNLRLNATTGVATGAFTGRLFTPTGEDTVSGTWTVRFQGPENLLVRGTVNGSFTATANVSAPLAMTIGPVTGTLSGNWTARVLPNGVITAEFSGSFDGGTLTVQTPLGPQQIRIAGSYLSTYSQSPRA